MLYVKATSKTVAQAVADLDAAVKKHSFGVLHSYDFKDILKSKGFDFPHECHVLEVCNPKQAVEVLKRNIQVNMALPCRLSVYQDGGKTMIGMMPPSDILGLLPGAAALAAITGEVETAMRAMIDEAAS